MRVGVSDAISQMAGGKNKWPALPFGHSMKYPGPPLPWAPKQAMAQPKMAPNKMAPQQTAPAPVSLTAKTITSKSPMMMVLHSTPAQSPSPSSKKPPQSAISLGATTRHKPSSLATRRALAMVAISRSLSNPTAPSAFATKTTAPITISPAAARHWARKAPSSTVGALREAS